MRSHANILHFMIDTILVMFAWYIRWNFFQNPKTGKFNSRTKKSVEFILIHKIGKMFFAIVVRILKIKFFIVISYKNLKKNRQRSRFRSNFGHWKTMRYLNCVSFNDTFKIPECLCSRLFNIPYSTT